MCGSANGDTVSAGLGRVKRILEWGGPMSTFHIRKHFPCWKTTPPPAFITHLWRQGAHYSLALGSVICSRAIGQARGHSGLSSRGISCRAPPRALWWSLCRCAALSRGSLAAREWTKGTYFLGRDSPVLAPWLAKALELDFFATHQT